MYVPTPGHLPLKAIQFDTVHTPSKLNFLCMNSNVPCQPRMPQLTDLMCHTAEAKRIRGQEHLKLSFREQQALQFANKRAEAHVQQAREVSAQPSLTIWWLRRTCASVSAYFDRIDAIASIAA